MIDELHKLLEVHERLLGFPQYVNLRKHVADKIQKLEDGAKTAEKPAAKVIPSATYETPDVERRV